MKRYCYAILGAIMATTAGLQANWGAYIPDWQQFVPGSGGQENVYYGPTNLTGQTFEELTVYGPAQLDGCTITDQATFAGPLKAHKSSFYALHVDGIATLDDVKVTTSFDINGPINAQNSTFEDISISSSELTLSNCTVKTLLVRKNGNQSPQVVYLDKGSRVDTLTFERTGGRVILRDHKSTVGRLTGGTTPKSTS